jgi:hypothetical protein
MALPKALAEELYKRRGEAGGDKAQTRIPPLESGDRLTRDEFERRYNAMPQRGDRQLDLSRLATTRQCAAQRRQAEGIRRIAKRIEEQRACRFREAPVAEARAKAEARINLVSGIKNFLPRIARPSQPAVQGTPTHT